MDIHARDSLSLLFCCHDGLDLANECGQIGFDKAHFRAGNAMVFNVGMNMFVMWMRAIHAATRTSPVILGACF
jgi:hypothetical protein